MMLDNGYMYGYNFTHVRVEDRVEQGSTMADVTTRESSRYSMQRTPEHA